MGCPDPGCGSEIREGRAGGGSRFSTPGGVSLSCARRCHNHNSLESRRAAMRLKKLAPLFLALSATLFAARFGIDHIGRIVRLADPQIAPDGKSIALVVSRTNYEEDRYDPELVLIDVATHNQRTLTRDRRGVSQARWSP